MDIVICPVTHGDRDLSPKIGLSFKLFQPPLMMLLKNRVLRCDKNHKLHDISEKFYNLLLYKP